MSSVMKTSKPLWNFKSTQTEIYKIPLTKQTLRGILRDLTTLIFMDKRDIVIESGPLNNDLGKHYFCNIHKSKKSQQ